MRCRIQNARHRLGGVVVGALLLITAASCTNAPPPADSGGPQGDALNIEKVIDADYPIAIVFAPDGRTFFTEKETGRVRIIKDGALLPTPFATVNVNSLGERGLLGIALHPDFANNGFVYVYYTRASASALNPESNRVARFTADGDVATGGEQMIIDLPVGTTATNHNGGNIRFGPDGKLYVTIGELADKPAAQDVSKLQGKMLRLNDDGSIPDDNPMPGSAVFAYGLRNSFDFAFDPVSGGLFATENGPNNDDELNLIVPAGNYGWPNVEGAADGGSEKAFADATPDYHDPMLDINPVVAPTGIDFAPDDTFGKANTLYYGEYKTGRIKTVELNDARDAVTSQSPFAMGIADGIIDVQFAPDGSMYVLTSTAIWRITPAN